VFQSGSKLSRAETYQSSNPAATTGFGNLVTLTEDYDF
jgi:hypothetical protein